MAYRRLLLERLSCVLYLEAKCTTNCIKILYTLASLLFLCLQYNHLRLRNPLVRPPTTLWVSPRLDPRHDRSLGYKVRRDATFSHHVDGGAQRDTNLVRDQLFGRLTHQPEGSQLHT